MQPGGCLESQNVGAGAGLIRCQSRIGHWLSPPNVALVRVPSSRWVVTPQSAHWKKSGPFGVRAGNRDVDGSVAADRKLTAQDCIGLSSKADRFVQTACACAHRQSCSAKPFFLSIASATAINEAKLRGVCFGSPGQPAPHSGHRVRHREQRAADGRLNHRAGTVGRWASVLSRK